MARALPRQNVSPPPHTSSAKRRTRGNAAAPQQRALSREAMWARRKFLRVFPGLFRDETYVDWERNYKWDAHRRWGDALGEPVFVRLVREDKFGEIAAAGSRIESRTM